MITGASFEKNGVKEWVPIVVTNYGREPNVKRGGEVKENCVLSEWKWSPLLHKERFPIPISWSHWPKWPAVQGRDIKIFISVQCCSTFLTHARPTMFYIPQVLLLGTQLQWYISSFLALDSPEVNVPSFKLKDFIMFIRSTWPCVSSPLILTIVIRINTATCGLENKWFLPKATTTNFQLNE